MRKVIFFSIRILCGALHYFLSLDVFPGGIYKTQEMFWSRVSGKCSLAEVKWKVILCELVKGWELFYLILIAIFHCTI